MAMTEEERLVHRLFAAAIAFLLVMAALATCGCSTTEVAEAQGRYRHETVSISLACIEVVTDTETGQRWLVASEPDGGVAIEPMDGAAQ